MTKLLEFFIIIVFIWATYTAICLLLGRLALVRKVCSLRTLASAEVRFNTIPHLSLLRLSRTPEITVRAGNTLYLVRLYNGGGIGDAVHFASPEFTVRFSRMKTASYTTRQRGVMSLTVLSRRGFAIGAKVIHLPPLDISTYTDDPTLRVVPVLIFSPAPGEVSFVTEERTSIMTAFTGDAVYGTRIFTPDTFVRYVERQHREERRIAEERASADLMHR